MHQVDATMGDGGVVWAHCPSDPPVFINSLRVKSIQGVRSQPELQWCERVDVPIDKKQAAFAGYFFPAAGGMMKGH